MMYANAVLGLLGVWLVYQLGTLLFDRVVGRLAALLLALNPIYLLMVYMSMSHLTATVCLLLAMWCWFKPSERRGSTLGWLSGLLIGYAIFTHLTSLLFVVPFVMSGITDKHPRLRAFLAGLVIASVFLVIYNWAVFGSPVSSGYHVIDESEQFSLNYIPSNLLTYADQLNRTMSVPLVLGVLGWLCVNKSLQVFFASLPTAFFLLFAPYYSSLGGGLFSVRFFVPLLPIFSWLAGYCVRVIGGPRQWVVAGVVALTLSLNVAQGFLALRKRWDTAENERLNWECIAKGTNPEAVILAPTTDGGKVVLLADRIAYDPYRTTPYELGRRLMRC